jgi:acyl-homoserine lactone acylase PvdQ
MRGLLLAAGLALAALAPAPAAAAPAPAPYGTGDPGGFWQIIPPGQGSSVNSVQAAQFGASGTRPAHHEDTREMYTDLLYATPGLRAEHMDRFFTDATFGVKEGDAERTYSPRDDVTIVRDRRFGIPRVYGETRAAGMFGLGYVSAEDRLFFMHALRKYGRGELSEVTGPSSVASDSAQFAGAPYTEDELQFQIDRLDDLYGAEGRQMQDDVASYVAGINAYIDAAKLNPSLMPVEFPALGMPGGPPAWKATDVVAATALIGATLGTGGGDEIEWAELLGRLRERFGPARGFRAWRDLRALDDPEAPVTAHRKGGFPYAQVPSKVRAGSIAVPDPGTYRAQSPVVEGPGSEEAAGRGALGGLGPALEAALRKQHSNALLVNRRHSKSGRPLLVGGSQAGYWTPEIYMAVEVHAPSIEARGATFPGLGLYVLLGRGRGYAWTATSAGQDIIDVYAVPTCQDDMHYEYRGRCLPFDVIEKTVSWQTSAVYQGPPGSARMRVLRSKLGVVQGRGTVGGRPVVFTRLRASYLHEPDSGIAFARINDPARTRSVEDFQRSMTALAPTFNWFYADRRDIGFVNTGFNPVRPRDVVAQLPQLHTGERSEWRGYKPDGHLFTLQPFAERPKAKNESKLTNWNNQQSRRCCGGAPYTPIWRSLALDRAIDKRIRRGRRIGLPQLVDASMEAATVDIRAQQELPELLAALGTPRPALRDAVAKLRAWVAGGAQRIDRDRDGTYEHSHAIRILDAWQPLLERAVLRPALGGRAFDALESIYAHNRDLPNGTGGAHNHFGSAFAWTMAGYVKKDLRRLLGRRVSGAYSLRFCGRGDRARCAKLLQDTLAQAVTADPAQIYADPTITPAQCGGMDAQACFDSLRYTPVGLVDQPLEPWQNRPTQQQAVEVGGP